MAMGGGWSALRRLIERVPSSEPEIAYSSLSRLASRLGYGPSRRRPSYEYADRLGELVPVASGDLRLIATAKVEATYGRRTPERGIAGDDRPGLQTGAHGPAQAAGAKTAVFGRRGARAERPPV